MNLKIVKTDSTNEDFIKLVRHLDDDLNERYGFMQKQYDAINSLDFIKDVVVIYKEGEPAACGALKEYDRECVEIKRVFVAKEYRKQGLAKQIMDELEKIALSRHYSCAILETGVKQHEAIHLYTRTGFAIIPNYGPYAGNANSVCMKKMLASNND